MSRYYVTVETPQGDFKWYLPVAAGSSITIGGLHKPNFSEFTDAALNDWGVDLTVGAYMFVNSDVTEVTASLASYFEKIPYNLVPAHGDIWKIGQMTGTWNVSGSTYSCSFKDPDNNVRFSIQLNFLSTPNSYQHFQCPLVYSLSENKLIVNSHTLWFYVKGSAPYYNCDWGTTTESTTSQNSIAVNSAVAPEEDTGETPDPYDDYSHPGGGPNPSGTGTTGTGGLGDTSSDAVPTPNTPSSISIGTGLFTAYNPSASVLASLGQALWNANPTDFNDLFRLLFGGDAFNSIIGLSMIPVSPNTFGDQEIKLGNWNSGVRASVIVDQYKQVNFGSVTLAEFWGNCIDYAPYTRVQLALPYIGIVDVDTDDVIGSVNTLTYNIDVFSGAICAMLHCVKGNLSSVIYQWSGSCAVQLPITGATFNNVVGSVMAVGGAVAGAVSVASGPIGSAIGAVGSMGIGAGLVSGAAANMFGSMKGKVQKSGGFSACSGALGIMTPYFIVTRPVQSIPSTQQTTKGYPANISAHIGDLVGYTEFEEVHLHDIPATKDEVLEIEALLKKGVIF